ncbi:MULTISPECIES: aspartyl-phosphate phosphatase Spo0E family protein [Bacillaceae]|uniref:Aspartyl-phosphate phosphatase Spo0E family protein n=1 Tax=Evansella alkalicola TaxID=745819 RepID=A0ABS6JUD1_9BACI|nr:MULTISPECIES: aspartyl-phosphate phosphatase Spo0E family protein [Bacillaceae]MBU9722103.1 aspartyl-phosphate phosphatase Spo0E family protein [Bacillus alkalicola]
MSIQNEIELKRKELLFIANEYGLSSKITLRCSEELDKLILTYQQKELNITK